MNLTYKDINYIKFLIRHYKYYKLNENELSLILCLDDILEYEEQLVTADDLLIYMTISKEEIDQILVSLLDKGYIQYISNSQGKMVTTLSPLYTKIIKDFKKDLYIENDLKKDKSTASKVNTLYTYFEELLGRPLKPKETDRINLWIQSGINENMVKEGVSKIKSKSKAVSIAAVDKVLHSIQKNQDIQLDGYSIHNDQEWIQNSEQTKEILSKPWVTSDD